MAFFKREDDFLLKAETTILGPGFEMYADQHLEYSYPVDGWYWFEDEAEAREALGLPPQVED